jgi:hypothetical protein
MSKFSHLRYFLLVIPLLVCAAAATAQDAAMMRPPIPDVLPPEPPDPYTLPAPPQLQWTSLPPRDEEDQRSITPPEDVPPAKEEEVTIPPPPPPVIETPLPGGANPADIELANPEVEIWRGESEWPQIPERRSNRLDTAYVTGTEPVWLRAQFDTRAAGMNVYVKPDRGITLNPPVSILTVSSNGECLVLAELKEGVDQSNVVFYCQGMRTVVPVRRSSLTTVIAAEEETGGGH